jgi:cytochrome c peroxidase
MGFTAGPYLRRCDPILCSLGRPILTAVNVVTRAAAARQDSMRGRTFLRRRGISSITGRMPANRPIEPARKGRTSMKRLIAPLFAALPLVCAAGEDAELRKLADELFGRVEAPAAAKIATPEVALGRALFWDTRVSLDGKTACASCHPAADFGADRRRLSPDARGELTSRNSPTIFNTMTLPGLRWLSDRKTGADQAEGSLTGSLGFKTKDDGVAKLAELKYQDAFKAAYPGDPNPLTAKNYGRALQAYQATLVTPSPFDRFLAGDDRAMTERQKAGLKAFIDIGCAACHDGPTVGGTQLRKFGRNKDYWAETGSAKPDVGRFAITKKEEDKYVFRVAMLRNVARTAPYFHDGSVDTLDRAVRVMGAVQLGRTLDDSQVSLLTAFLESLTGSVPAHYSAPH